MNSYMEKYYGFLKGAKIIGAGLHDDGEFEWPYFKIEKDGQEFEVEVSQDPEGNGPGFLFGLPRPEVKDE